MLKFAGRLVTFSALGASLILSGCGLRTRVVATANHSAASPNEPVTDTFTATDKMDVLISVDPSNLTTAQQKQISGSIDQIIAELDKQGIDYHMGLVGAGGGAVSGFPISIPGLGNIGNIGGSNDQSDWLSAGLGALTVLGDNDRFLTSDQRHKLEDDLLDHLTQGVQNKLGSSTRAKFQDAILPLLPIVVKAAQGGSSQQDLKTIYAQVAPYVMAATSNGQLGGNYTEAIKAVLPIVQMAAGGGVNNQKFDSLVAALLPIAINVGLKSQGANPYVAAASVLLPAVLKLSDKAQNGASFDELMGSVIPIVLSQVGSSQSGDYLKMVGLVVPMVNSVLANAIKGKLDPKDLLGDLLPMALSSIGNQGASQEYTYLLSAVMPVVLNMIQDQKLGNDPSKLLQTVSQLGLANVLGALDTGKTQAGGVNAGFLRDDAVLSVLMVGEKFADGQKQDPKELANSFVNILLESKLGAKEKLAFDAILGGSTNICSSQTGKSSSVYKEIAALTGGEVADLCNNPNKFGDILVSSILSKLTEYTLSQVTDSKLVQVFENGLEVPQGTDNGWSLSVDGKTIKLNGSYIPSANSKIEVLYVPVS